MATKAIAEDNGTVCGMSDQYAQAVALEQRLQQLTAKVGDSTRKPLRVDMLRIHGGKPPVSVLVLTFSGASWSAPTIVTFEVNGDLPTRRGRYPSMSQRVPSDMLPARPYSAPGSNPVPTTLGKPTPPIDSPAGPIDGIQARP